ncbi:ATP-binding protein [Zobellia russellii]|uniref:ATP-binding protein n=1 Tax=Zobellia russellii TaxID=248907 RepID=UPI001BFF46C1|nr:ATP-binding protein [Zobellia russellii]MBT9187760.1 ATP-binding protein [Zobellia russellii]
MSDNFKPLQINADRICEAISKIGYKPSSAILDIVDNSVVAEAKNMIVRLFMKKGKTLNNIQNIDKIQIVDNGKGMDDKGIEKALQLGSDVAYGTNSLSKYGLGLKSAGFSLGERIEVVSKINGSVSEKFYLDRDVIRAKDAFGYEKENVPESQLGLLSTYESGTVITIDKLTYTSRVTAANIIAEIADRAGVSYCDYLKPEDVTFKVEVIKADENSETVVKKRNVEPRDILFWDKALDTFNKEDYDCKKPCKVLDEYFENPMDIDGEKIRIQATIFPKASMKSFASFSEDERKDIKEYDVTLKNSGFYFYRNGRLIKWGEKLFLSRLFGFRAKISFGTEHDDLFDVDVSKQHLTVSEEVEKKLDTLTKVARGQSKELFQICDEVVKALQNNGTEGSEFNNNNATLEEEEDETTDAASVQVLERKTKLEEKSEEHSVEDDPDYEEEGDKKVFRRVRYWQKGRNLWESATDRLEGTYVLINTLHPFYDLVISKFDVGSAERQSIEALIFSLAVGENQTIQKFVSVEADIAIEIFKKYNRASSNQLDHWVNNNWDLYETES